MDQVALTLDFASANAFRNLLRRYADLGPGDLRRDRGAALRLAFQDALAGRPRGGAVPAAVGWEGDEGGLLAP